MSTVTSTCGGRTLTAREARGDQVAAGDLVYLPVVVTETTPLDGGRVRLDYKPYVEPWVIVNDDEALLRAEP